MKKQDRYIFPAVFTYEDGKEIAVIFPDFDTATSGVDDNDAFSSARELLGCTIFGLEEDGEEIPAPSKISDITVESNECVAMIEVYMPSVRMAENNKSVNRTVTLPAWLNTAAIEKGINFSGVLQDALKARLNI